MIANKNLSYRNDERSFIIECIKLYSTLPALWDLKSKEYFNRQEKNNAYEVLLTKYREKYPSATRTDLTRKFNSLRTNYRKELKRLNYSNGKESTLWYFNELAFLQDKDTICCEVEIGENSDNNTTNNCENVRSTVTVEHLASPTKKKKCLQEEFLFLSRNRFKSSKTEYEKIANAWAVELAKLSPEQQIHAKKSINEVLYEGQLGNLYRNAVRINPPPENCTNSKLVSS